MQEQTKVKLNVRDIQLIGLEMLIAFDAYCAKYGLDYYLCGGTLLGAVRHKGFIPWDDDVDVFMSRPDYEKLIELTQKEPIGEGMTFACPQNGIFIRPFARIYYDITSVYRFSYNEESGAHVWMDILPVDGLPKDKKKWKGIYKRRDFMSAAVMATMWNVGAFTRKLDMVRRPFFYAVGCSMGGRKRGHRFWCDKLEKLGKRYPFETSEVVACVTAGRYGPGEAMPREMYDATVDVSFEGLTFKAMKGWHEYLSGIYGDYMQLPPENRRYPHLNTVTMAREDYIALCERHPELAGKHPEAGL